MSDRTTLAAGGLAGANGAAGTARLATDARGLDGLKRAARESPDKALAGAARQFEAVFMQMLMKSMRDAVPSSGMFESSAGDLYTGMLDGELSQKLGGKGLGIADMIIKQIEQAQKGRRAPASQGLESAAEAGGAQAARGLPSGEGARDGGRFPPVLRAPVAPTAPTAPSAPLDPAAIRFPASTSQLLDRLSSATRVAAGGAGASGAQAFVDRMLPHATTAARATGVPPQFILGQAALESGWGRREIVGADGTKSFNLFGIKAGRGWNGPTVAVTTTEYVDGQPRKQVERFRAYGSYAEGFADYARLIGSNPRYAEVLRQGQDAGGFAQSLQRAGYATDPAYAAKLTRVINHTLALARVG